jgi:hypothetical protein
MYFVKDKQSDFFRTQRCAEELTPPFGHPSARGELHFLDLHSSAYSPHVEGWHAERDGVSLTAPVSEHDLLAGRGN